MIVSRTYPSLKNLNWESRFVDQFPGDSEKRNFTRQVKGVSFSEVHPTPVSAPHLVAWSDELASELGIARPDEGDSDSLMLLTGNAIHPKMKPYASRYGGHQFGNWAGQLGDGRAILLGEAMTLSGRQEFQLKGAGPTPYSRRADGRAVLRSSIREFLCSEAMHFLGVPTTRALSLVATGDQVVRDMFYDGNPHPEPGAIVCRVAPSFLRFGHFEILAAQDEPALLKKLADYLITEHYPDLDLNDSDVYGKLLDQIAIRTATLLTHWMRVGFVHGVMNTDNMSMLGLTIDYGPYGWLEPVDADWTPNTTDAEGRRYRYGGQPEIAFWNLTRLAESFFSLVGNEDRIRQSLKLYPTHFEKEYGQMMANKLGLQSMHGEEDRKLFMDLFNVLQSAETDFTLFFRSLCDIDEAILKSDGNAFLKLIQPAFYSFETIPASVKNAWHSWSGRFAERINKETTSFSERQALMKKTNPKYVLRNYLSQNAIQAAEKGDYSLIERLLKVLKNPYDDQPSEEDLATRRPDWARNAPGCSALSCSS